MFNSRRCPGSLKSLPWILAALVALCTGAGFATAAPRSLGVDGQATAPVIDGKGDDLISFAAGLTGRDCGLSLDDARDDISIADPKIVVCSPFEDTDGNAVPDYFVNGFDTRKFVFAYDRANKNLYILWRTEGLVGDTDGNLNPDNNLCPPAFPTFADEPGIGSQENYQARLDTNCDGAPDIIISVGGVLGTDQVTVQGVSFNGSQVAYRAVSGASGKDLELRISDITLPQVFVVRGNSNASFDGLGEDITGQLGCTPNPSIDVEKTASVGVICPGGTADFTVVVTNNGTVDLTGVTVVDNLPAGLLYQQTVSNTCGGATNAVGSQITYGPFDLAAGASCTIVIRVGRTAECAGEQVNNVSVEGTFQSPCFQNNQPTVVSDEDAASVLCGNVQCSISAPDTHVCPGETVQICGPEGNFTYAWSTGAVTRCITVGAGTYSLVVTDVASGCVSNNNCAVTIIEDPRPTCSISAPDTRVCPGETVQICGPEGNYSYAWSTGAVTRCITVGAGTYSLVITDLATGCVSNNSCAVTINEDPRPTCSISAPDTRVCPGETVQICGPEGNYSYAWSTGAVTRCITVGAGTYSLVITDLATGCVSNNSCAVTIIEDPRPTCSISAPDTDVCPGETVQICGPEGNYSYAWSTGAVTRCITVGAGTYSLVITDLASGCVSNNSCAVTITEAPRPNCSISAPDTRVCPGETVQICGPEGNYTYAWSTGAVTRCITVGAGTYSLVITTPGGCVSNNSCSVTISEDPRPTCSISADKDAVCKNETAQLCGPEGPYTYAWSTGETTRCINVGAGTYSLVITNTETGCISNNSCTKTIGVRTQPCVEVTVNAPDALCAGAAFELCGTVKNCGSEVADLEVRYGDVVRSFTDVPAGASREWCVPAVMPNCTGGSASFEVTAKASNDCGDATQPGSDNVACKVPLIDVEKVAQESTVANGGTIHYSITVRNPSATVALEDVTVVDDLCAYAVWTGVTNRVPASAPAVGSAGGVVTWEVGDLAAGAQVVITFEVTADVAAGGGACPTTVQCQNDVYATGLCAGGGADQTPVRDDDSITTPITCVGEACPRTVGFWGAQCAQKGNGSTKFTAAQMTQIAACVDDQSEFFNWGSDDFAQFCRTLSTSNMNQRVQAKRQFAGVLANMCTDVLDLQPSQGGSIYLDPSTPVSCAGLEADTIGELIDEVDAILAELEGQSLNDGAVKSRYGQLISCLDGINNGRIIATRPDCEHGSVVPSNEGAELGDGASVDAGASVSLYRPSPNPFSGSTSFAYRVDADQAAVEIGIYDVAGRQIRKIVSGVQTAGQYTASWDGRTESGAKATRGVYFVRTVIAGVKANVNRVLYLSE